MEDLLLAIQAREAYNFIQPPPQSVSLARAEKLGTQYGFTKMLKS